MKQFPPLSHAEDAPSALFDSGHLWIQEQIAGSHLRFRLRDSGMLQFGDRTRVFDADEIPLPYQHAVRHVREAFDRTALRDAHDDVESVVFFGEATHQHAIDYDWGRTPSFLGFDVWSEADGEFLPPDTVEQVYDRLGLRSVNVFEKEVRATDFDPQSYETPASKWYDGPAAGVVVRNKTGQRAKIPHPDFRGDHPQAGASSGADASAPEDASAEELARTYTTDARVERIVRELESADHAVTFDAVYERVVEDVARREHRRLFEGQRAIDVQAFRSEVAAQTQQLLDT